jgi:hypothetical protein
MPGPGGAMFPAFAHGAAVLPGAPPAAVAMGWLIIWTECCGSAALGS